MKQNVKKTACAICVLILVICGLIYFNRVTDRRDDDYKYAPFFGTEGDFDVEFFGTSHVIYGIYPMNLWKEYGITSYNFGGHGNSVAVSFLQFENAIEYHKPKVAVLDVLGTFRDTNDMLFEFEQSHISLDAFPLTKTKIKGVYEVFDDKDERFELLIPFSSYHSRWSELNGNAYIAPFVKESSTVQMGAEMGIGIAEGYEKADVPKDDIWGEDTISMAYVQKFIDVCKKEDIEPLLIFLPDPMGKEAMEGANSVYELAKKNDVPYINFTYDGPITDVDTDFSDLDAHLNTFGAGKISEYLGEYLIDNYEIKDKRALPEYAEWKMYEDAYAQLLINDIEAQESPETVLSMLYSPYFSADIILNETGEANEIRQKLISVLNDTSASITYAKDDDPEMQIIIHDETGKELLKRVF